MIAKKILARVENRAFTPSSLATRVTVSIGLATDREHPPVKPQDAARAAVAGGVVPPTHPLRVPP